MKKIGVTVLLILLMLAAVGCGEKPQMGSGGGETVPNASVNDQDQTVGVVPDTSQGSQNTSNNEQTDLPELKSQKIKVYYTDDQLIDLKEMELEIKFKDDGSKYSEAFKALQSVSGTDVISLWEKIILKSISFAKDELTIDIQLPNEARLGSGGEALALDALKATFFQFDEVKKLELTVNGEQVDSLMGHVELEHPMTK